MIGHTKQHNTLWGGNFANIPSEEVLLFTSGFDVRGKKPYDERLIPYDIKVNRAHTQMLSKQGIMSGEEAERILQGLDEIEALYNDGEFILDLAREDVHTNIEAYITEKFGAEVGGKMHTARSRNDQIATVMRLYLKESNKKCINTLVQLTRVLKKFIKKHAGVAVPGFTHHRPAVVTTLDVVFGAFRESFKRDALRCKQWNELYDSSPLGAVTGYGTSFKIDTDFTSQELGFNHPEKNTLDPINNRGEAETALVFTIACIMKHLSQLAQTLILWSMPQFGYITLADEFCTGSSAMPHKKNPDVLEVIKAKTSFVYGSLHSLLSINSSNLIGYNRDTQWTKYAVMDVIDEVFPSMRIITQLLESITIHEAVLKKACTEYGVDLTQKMEREIQKTGEPFRLVKQKYEERLGVRR